MPPKKANPTQAKTRKTLTEKTFHGDSEKSEQPNPGKTLARTGRSKETAENCDNNNADAATKEKAVSGKRSLKAVVRNIVVEQSKKKSSSKIADNNNNNNSIQNIKEPFASKILIAKLCTVERTKMPTPNTDYTENDLKGFILSSSIESFDFSAYSTEQIFCRFIDLTYKIKEVTLAQLVDLYSLAIIMQSYKPLETLCSKYRSELLDAVAQLPVDMPIDLIEFIGTCLCNKFVTGSGMNRMERVVKMQHALSNLIIMGDLNQQIAMSVLLATFVKVSGKQPKQTSTYNVISQTFEMIKLIDWMQLSITGNVADMFILVRCFSLILNTADNRKANTDWNTELGQEIYTHFMRVLNAVRLSPKYDYFEMMVERYLAFGVICNARKRTNVRRITK